MTEDKGTTERTLGRSNGLGAFLGCALPLSSRRRHTRCLSDGVQTCALPFSSRRRHTRCLSDWSSDVCSSDLQQLGPVDEGVFGVRVYRHVDARSEERRVGKSVDLGGRRIIKKKTSCVNAK